MEEAGVLTEVRTAIVAPSSAARKTKRLGQRAFPSINPMEPESLWHVWPEVNPAVIGINYLGLCRNKSLLARARAEGIHRALDFDGEVIAIVVGRNWALEKLDIPTYASDLDQMGFDYGTTSDDYVYPDDPASAQWERIQCMLDDAVLLAKRDPDPELIGIVQGSTRQQIRFEMDQLSCLGIDRMALTAADSALRREHHGIVDFLGIGAQMGVWRCLLGINSLSLMSRFKAEGMSGYGWLYRAVHGYAYRGQHWMKPSQAGFCNHEICRSLLWKGFSEAELRTRHNVVTLMELSAKMDGGD